MVLPQYRLLTWEEGQEEVVVSSLKDALGEVHKVVLALVGPLIQVELVDQISQEQIFVDAYLVEVEESLKFQGAIHLAEEQGVWEVQELALVAWEEVEEEVFSMALSSQSDY